MLKAGFLVGIFAFLTACGSNSDKKDNSNPPPSVNLAEQAPEGSSVYGFWEIDPFRASSGPISLKRFKLDVGSITVVAECGVVNEKTFTLKAVASIKADTIEILENKKQEVKHDGSTCRVNIYKTKEALKYKLSDDNKTLTLFNNTTGEQISFKRMGQQDARTFGLL